MNRTDCIYVGIHSCACTHTLVCNKKKDHKFEREQGGAWEELEREKGRGK